MKQKTKRNRKRRKDARGDRGEQAYIVSAEPGRERSLGRRILGGGSPFRQAGHLGLPRAA